MKRAKIVAGTFILIVFAIQSINIVRKNITCVRNAIHEISCDTGPYILVKCTATTGAWWSAIGDQDGLYPKSLPIEFIGKGLPAFSDSIELGDNTFVCYGTYQGKADVYGIGEEIDVFQMIGWDVMYPIDRKHISLDTQFLNPREYLTVYDFANFDEVA